MSHISVWAMNYSEAQNDTRHFWYIIIKKNESALPNGALFSKTHSQSILYISLFIK